MGEIIWMKPLGTDSKDFSKLMEPRSQKYTNVNTRASMEPMARPAPEEALENAPMKSPTYSLSASKKPPV